MSFERDPRRRQEIAGRPIADDLYRQVFGQNIAIARMEREEDKELDKRFAIDVEITLSTGQILLGQEKFLSYEYARYRSVTVEYEQNQFTKERGDWFRLATQLYFVGYFTADGKRFDPWVLLNWPNIVIATSRGRLRWFDNNNQNGRARASFRWCRMDNIPQECLIASSMRQLVATGDSHKARVKMKET